MNPVVELIAATKRYGQVEALRGVNLAIQSGEIVAMLGPTDRRGSRIRTAEGVFPRHARSPLPATG